MSRLPFLFLGLLASALTAAILLQLEPSEEAGNLPEAAPRRAPVQAPAPAAGQPGRTAEWVATILARPLLSPDRRPAAPGTAAARPADTALPRLTGTLVTPAGRSAIFAGGSAPLVVREGGQVGAFTVRRIEPGQVTLQGPEGLRTLGPRFDPNRPAAAGTGAPAGTAAPAQSQLPRPPGPAAGTVPAGAGALPPLPTPGGPPLPAPGGPGLPDAPSPEDPGAAEGAVPFEQNATPSGSDILRNANRQSDSAGPGGVR
ncbi:hypothetical protein [Roseomonas indoligenes]|uniref:Type II secretion system protein GspC N-terminal domain-containing protein n=1 Tax=Roseomonas indoligenes TaxID=2820811 RepID=A0A940S7D7_9PROT|nr:hypothetical protein [Pararoseomonas indoligenes]MBP0494954.1 hypothetical protein [Pararoseomonas indoligenes]